MVGAIAELRQTSDEDLIAEHDRLAVHTEVGTAYYMDQRPAPVSRPGHASGADAGAACLLDDRGQPCLALVAVVTSALLLG
jgi:hypothetical protein